MAESFKRLLLGSPLPSSELAHQRLSKRRALALLANDALSSVAYAPEEILLVLAVAAVPGASGFGLPIALAITLLLGIVAVSYSQTLQAYPSGGGSYTVAKENLGTGAGLLAAAALLIDYLLTVAVSVASGVANLASAFPMLRGHAVLVCVAVVVVITLVHLRGIRESAAIMQVPTYLFIASFGLMLAAGAWRWATGTLPTTSEVATPSVSTVGCFLVLKAFSSGCTAMTGVEAISNGIQVFREPVTRNARITLAWMVAILATYFVGASALAHAMGLGVREDRTIIAQLSQGTFGTGWLFYLVQVATMLVLVFAANTSFADFPRLCSVVARDGYLPRQLTALGDRLVFSNGILVLGAAAIALLVAFGGDTHALIPLFAIGAFLSFTLSQAGMAVHWWRERAHDVAWRRKLIVNGAGAAATGITTLVVATTKFTAGAWIVVLLLPAMVALFRATQRHYLDTAVQLGLTGVAPAARPQPLDVTVLIPVANLHRGVLTAIQFASTLSRDVRAVHVDVTGSGGAALEREWPTWGQGVRLVTLASPYRSITAPLLAYVQELQTAPDKIVTVVIPEFVTTRWWEAALHNQTAFVIKWALLTCRRRVIVVSVPQYLV